MLIRVFNLSLYSSQQIFHIINNSSKFKILKLHLRSWNWRMFNFFKWLKWFVIHQNTWHLIFLLINLSVNELIVVIILNSPWVIDGLFRPIQMKTKWHHQNSNRNRQSSGDTFTNTLHNKFNRWITKPLYFQDKHNKTYFKTFWSYYWNKCKIMK